MTVTQSPLGKAVTYQSTYQRDLLFPIPRQIHRDKLKVDLPLPFQGADVWNAYELSWLNAKGKPVVAIAEFIFPCTSPNLIESKSFKLYLNSFNNTRFESASKVVGLLQNDLAVAAGASVQVNLWLPEQFNAHMVKSFSGICLDNLDIACDTYHEPGIHFLKTEGQPISENLYSNLLKSNCLVTGQPDWASVQIHYSGKKINHEGLLKYLISFRNHNEFHEQCVERMYMDIMRNCAPEKLWIEARYTRRGGLEINPWRGNYINYPVNHRLPRQ